ncbi:MAG: peptide chain release factor [Fibrobacteraceae bacterium]|nr:peptide chain release factor [Fibrobacteraceae bacterium]
MHRDDYLQLPLDELLRACTLKGYQGSGPGGQHRNKTNTGVCLRLAPYNLEIKSCESRSVSENKTHALHRMQLALAIYVREPPKPESQLKFPGSNGRIQTSNPQYPQFIANVLDIVEANGGDTKVAAKAFGLSPTALTKILHADKHVLKAMQDIRAKKGRPPLKR